MGFVSEAQIDEIRRRTPLEELLPEYNVHLIPAGRQLKALCPFHREKTPSFMVDRDKQLFFCHGCQMGGDVFSFVQAMDGLDWREAVEMLARRAGVLLEETSDARGRRRTLDLYDALELAARWYHRILLEEPQAEPARRYLHERSIDEAMWRKFLLGYSLPEWDNLLRHAVERGISASSLEAAGLARRRQSGGGWQQGGAGSGYLDYFHGRLMFPISDIQGRPIGFGARTLGDDQPKYLNTPKTQLFDKSQVLYALAQAKGSIRREGRISIVEGYTDAIMAHQAGLETFVASLGTAFTEENARQLMRLAPRVFLVFDGDAAGQRASERSLDLLVTQDLDVKVYTVTEGKDPCESIIALGGEEFQRRLETESVNLFEFKWRCTAGSAEAASSATAKARLTDEFVRLVARISNAVTRKLVLREYSERLRVGEAALEQRLLGILRGQPSSSPPEPPAAAGDAESPGELAELVLQCMMALPERARAIWESTPRAVFEGEIGRRLADAVDRQLAEGDFCGVRLQRKLSDLAAVRVAVKLLRSLQRDDGTPAYDFEALWHNCQRDLGRWTAQRRLSALAADIEEARRGGDEERAQSARVERQRLLKELKRAGGGGRHRVDSGSLV